MPRQQTYRSLIESRHVQSSDESDYGQPPAVARGPSAAGIGAVQVPQPLHMLMYCVRAFPIIACAAWGFTLIGLLVCWTIVDGEALYKWYLGAIPFISNVGAVHKTFFMTGCVITALFYSASLLAERYLRTKRVLVEATEERLLWTATGCLDVFAGIVGALALVLLSYFDAHAHGALHNVFMCTFIIAVAVSGVLQTSEVEHLWHEHPDRHDLREATLLKWTFLGIAIIAGAGFWGLYQVCDGDASKSEQCWRLTTGSAVLEWAACFMTVAYLATLAVDLWPAYRHTPLTHRAWATSEGVQGLLVLQPDGTYRHIDLSQARGVERPVLGGAELWERAFGGEGREGWEKKIFLPGRSR